MKKLLCGIGLLLCCGDVVRPAGSDRRSEHSDRGADSECDRADDARKKVRLCFGGDKFGEVVLPGVPRLGILPMYAADGPRGIRAGAVTVFPSGLGLAATWNPALVGDRTRDRQREPGQRHIHGIRPCVQHQPRSAGRALFEYLTEDPFLSGEARRRTGARDTERRRFGLHQSTFAANGRDLNRSGI